MLNLFNYGLFFSLIYLALIQCLAQNEITGEEVCCTVYLYYFIIYTATPQKENY